MPCTLQEGWADWDGDTRRRDSETPTGGGQHVRRERGERGIGEGGKGKGGRGKGKRGKTKTHRWRIGSMQDDLGEGMYDELGEGEGGEGK